MLTNDPFSFYSGHRGQETVTYMLDGEFQHEDFKGHRGLLKPGSLQWMVSKKNMCIWIVTNDLRRRRDVVLYMQNSPSADKRRGLMAYNCG